MEIKQLEYFLAVSETKSFTRAAKRLFVSQPSVTNIIRSLEDELGIQLFERSQKQMLLTSEGRIFHSHVEHLMKGISHTLEEINAIKNLNGGALHIGVAPFGAGTVCAGILRAFAESYPEICVTLAEADSDELQKQLHEGSLDLAVMTDGETPPTLEAVSVMEEELLACCGRNHPLRRSNTLRPAELSGETLILLKDGGESMDELRRTLEATGIRVFPVGQAQTAKSLAASGFGIAILPETLCETESTLHTVALDPPLHVSMQLAYKKTGRLSHAAEAFVELARKGGKDHE